MVEQNIDPRVPGILIRRHGLHAWRAHPFQAKRQVEAFEFLFEYLFRGRSVRYVELRVGPGDLITVPAGTRHWFTLAEDRRIHVIRLFWDPAGWAAMYDNDPPGNRVTMAEPGPTVSVRLLPQPVSPSRPGVAQGGAECESVFA